MFTGIVQSIGEIKDVEFLQDNSIRISIDCNNLNSISKLGESISINGICLTVENIKNDCLVFTAISETINKTKMGDVEIGDKVNIEMSAKMNDLIGGHLVSGHVDTVGKVLNIEKSENWVVLRVTIDVEFKNLVIEKGSICLDGVSLTISKIDDSKSPKWFEVSLIPATLENTTLGKLDIHSELNLEFDQVAKYIAKNMAMING